MSEECKCGFDHWPLPCKDKPTERAIGPSELGFRIARRLSKEFIGGHELPTSMLHLIANVVDSEIANTRHGEIASITAELRHLYQNMITPGAVKDTAAIAKGLLGPQIERLEKL